ncbi:hypothetical protein X781_22170 [Mannheimia sp. USDA-ARS-USMARC-1261]|nr:hypothetical protein X781_22170 [Mannheimia sp. USDA-ARS-USMARC-1261]
MELINTSGRFFVNFLQILLPPNAINRHWAVILLKIHYFAKNLPK